MILTEAEARVALGIDATISNAERSLLTLLLPEAHSVVKQYLGYDPEQRSRTEFYPRARPDGHQNPVEGRYESTGMRAVFVPENVESTLLLAHLPIRSVTSVFVDYSARFGQADGAFPADTEWDQGVDFYIDAGQSGLGESGLLIAERGWPQIPGAIKVVYTAGYSDLEFSGRDTTGYIDASPIKSAVLESLLIAWHRTYATRKKSNIGFVPGAISSESMGSYSYSLGGSSSQQMLTGMTVTLSPASQDRLEKFRHYGLMLL
jgi:hypothetical protein